MEVELNNSSSIRNRGAYEIALKYSHERKALKEISITKRLLQISYNVSYCSKIISNEGSVSEKMQNGHSTFRPWLNICF
jgi:hypothetical protein